VPKDDQKRLRQTDDMVWTRSKKTIHTPAEPPVPTEGTSALVGRVLDQLSVTAWLPAALLVASVSILLEFRDQRSIDLPNAIDSLTRDPLQVLVITIPILVIATMVTQAFSFQAIRTLEGYNANRWPLTYINAIMINRHALRMALLAEELRVSEDYAFENALKEMWKSPGLSSAVIWAIEAERKGREAPKLTRAQKRELLTTDWQAYALAADLSTVERLAGKLDLYPSRSRMMPTLLGNCLRSVEDGLGHVEGDLESFGLQRRERAPARLRVHHDQFRNRLDMYCTLVFVTALLAVGSALILAGSGLGLLEICIVSLSFFALCHICYRAAVQSAQAYGTMLRELDRL
jgi:hypothetical protein